MKSISNWKKSKHTIKMENLLPNSNQWISIITILYYYRFSFSKAKRVGARCWKPRTISQHFHYYYIECETDWLSLIIIIYWDLWWFWDFWIQRKFSEISLVHLFHCGYWVVCKFTFCYRNVSLFSLSISIIHNTPSQMCNHEIYLNVSQWDARDFDDVSIRRLASCKNAICIYNIIIMVPASLVGNDGQYQTDYLYSLLWIVVSNKQIYYRHCRLVESIWKFHNETTIFTCDYFIFVSLECVYFLFQRNELPYDTRCHYLNKNLVFRIEIRNSWH